MLKQLLLENYRGFKRYELQGLSRTNLLVGKNNCGKTSLLEAVHLLNSRGDLTVLADIAEQRGEVSRIDEELSKDRRDSYSYDFIHFFHGRDLVVGAYFKLAGSDAVGEITARIGQLSVDEEDDESGSIEFPEMSLTADEFLIPSGLTMQIVGSGFPALEISEQGGVLRDNFRHALRHRPHIESDPFPIRFVTARSLSTKLMAGMWDEVLRSGRENEVITAMRILESSLESIAFLSGRARYGGLGEIVAGFAGNKRRLPLGSYGDGIRRLLALSLSLITTSGGVLLIDEIDTGLHYSVLGDMWRLVVNTARKSNVQVFATTHSLDCVRALGWFCENHPDLAEDVSLQKIDPELDESVAFDAERIKIAVDQEIEVR